VFLMAESDIERLRDSIDHAWEEARSFGLDPFPTHFELVPASIMYEFASYSLPGRFSHWTHGKAYHRQKMQYDFGLSKIYEMVVNTNPSYAFLMEMNDLLQNTFVAAHVFGHTDFFKNNAYFQHTSRRMIDKASIHAERIAQYEFDHGKAEVERFLDAVLSIQEHVDYNLFIREEKPRSPDERILKSPGAYDDLWSLDERARQAAEERDRRPGRPARFPEKPQKDLLLFLSQHAPHLETWQRDILEIVRTEMLYFVPQMQTKILNEGWACLTGNSLVLTEYGLLRFADLHTLLASQPVRTASGQGALDPIVDRHLTRKTATIRLHTRRGLILEGAQEHRVSIGPDRWLALKDVQIGQRLPLSAGEQIWPQQPVMLPGPASHDAWTPVPSQAVALPGRPEAGRRAPAVACLEHSSPTRLTAGYAAFLGNLCAAGDSPAGQHTIGLTTGEREAVEHYTRLVLDLFAIETQPVRLPRRATEKYDCWRALFSSATACELLATSGLDLQTRQIPAAVLRSPRAVVSAFLRAYADCAARVSAREGITLCTPGEESAQTLQVVLLNYGILAHRTADTLCIQGASAQLFAREIGLTLAGKQAALAEYLAGQVFSAEDDTDEVVGLEHDVADVYDITVDRSHRYVANGLLHHNSIWHSRIMRRLGETGIISDSQTIEFAQLHSSVLSPSRTSLNPYYLGFKMFEDVERRWNTPTREEQDRLGRQPGGGLQKIFEIREMENDVSFLRNYLTEELVKDLDLYLYKKEGDEWVIVEKNWEKVRDGIVASLNNFSSPYLVVDNGDYHGNRELYLVHVFEKQELDMNYAEKTLQHVYLLWGRPVHLETVYDGKKILLSYDGERNSKTTLEK
jgi:stage V sporulation protein R